jgi:hypothetical protein
VGDPVEPVADQFRLANTGSLSDEHQERRLKRVIRIMCMAQDAPADAEHHRPVSAHEHLEGNFIVR